MKGGLAMMLTACMMLDHVGDTGRSDRIRGAIGAVIAEGRVRTYDMFKVPGGAEALRQGAASTTQMTEAVLEKL